MRLPFFSMFMTSPFEGLQEHAEKVKECGWAFQQAIECHLSEKCKTFEEFRQEVIRLESDADAIKRRIRGHLPKGTLMPVYNFLLFRYLREQDQVIDAVEDALDWISFRPEPGIPTELEKDFVNLADAVIEPIEQLGEMVSEARKYFKNYSEAQRVVIKNIIHTLRRKEHEADKLEDIVKQKVLNMDIDAVTVFHIVRLAEIIGSIADHAENAGDMMRAMVAR
ncbi:MAG: TIGR00153 family protein [Deltaproteobacteria bacterium]|nr:TIGR00153 family protein [Deltaproteobacteria bacterium]MBW1967886.1 TIGR00153 family protein [Deltaproteobacteria bacterium]MBW2155799.1 TIGR00153 family protein [Deltaproteobacteria bacterium]MBW2225744.1 TIGR00153 family protein [Deltaproteobacteria bacterium]MBW2324930.1 TIGR00153 family protein [Deltaproteobacteria bacterium]